MPNNAIRRALLALSALPPLLSLTSCGDRPALAVVKPVPALLADQPKPPVPDASTPCPAPDDPAAMCISDADNARWIAGWNAAVDAANKRFAQLRAFFERMPD